MYNEPYNDLIIETRHGELIPWHYSQMQRMCPFLEKKAISKKYEELKMFLQLPYTKELINLLIKPDKPLSEYKWLDLERVMEDMKNDEDFDHLKAKVFLYILKHISIRNCIGIWLKLEIMNTTLAEKALRFILYNMSRGVRERKICLQFYRLTMEQLRRLLDDDRLNVRSEDEVLNIMEAWIDVCDGRRDSRDKLLGVVRVDGLSAEKKSSFMAENRLQLLCQKSVRPPRDQLVMFGGWYGGRTHSRIDIYDEMRKEWKPLCDLSLIHPIAYHGAVVLNDELYVIGGTDGENHYSTVMKMNMFGEWTEVAPMYETRTYISNSCCVMDGMIYVCGGFDVRSMSHRRRHDRLKCVERYDPALNRWERIPDMNQMRSDAAAASAGGKLYVSGGFNGNEVLQTVEVYSLATNAWTEIASLPSPRSGHCMLLFDPYTMIVLGGFNGDDRLTSVCTWKIGHLSWSEDAPPMKNKRSNFSACFFDGKLVVAGGYSVSSTIAGVEKFDGEEWSDMPDLPTNRSAMKIIVLPDFRDFAMTKLGTDETRKKWLEQERGITLEKSGALQRHRNGDEQRHMP
ncbi:unnamed protein product [Cylicocyclus nassatus]|uniref:BACK domain-containing protein n=1 Tax=Cylicocyclus nassatus TaxID=53992 RepID=A0AA36DP46_CYLNA|nr:unnamed protein product [Cylicocyclus nassatus]